MANEPTQVNPGHPQASSDDPRVRHFLDLIDAVDRADAKRGIVATRALRALGYSVVLTTPRGQGRRP